MSSLLLAAKTIDFPCILLYFAYILPISCLSCLYPADCDASDADFGASDAGPDALDADFDASDADSDA